MRSLGRTIKIVVGSETPTSNWDPVNRVPIDPNEPVTYDDVTYTINNVSIKWFKEEDLRFDPGGTLKPGSCRVKCKIEDVLAPGEDVNGETLFERARYVEIDGKRCELISKPVKTGLKDLFMVTAYLESLDAG
jgi:hypothetical protein